MVCEAAAGWWAEGGTRPRLGDAMAARVARRLLGVAVSSAPAQCSVPSGGWLEAGLHGWSYGSHSWASLLHRYAPTTQPSSTYWGVCSRPRTFCAAAAATSAPAVGAAGPVADSDRSEISQLRLRSSELRSPAHVLKLNMLGGDASRRFGKRVGRGIGSGKGKTAGRGHKGQRARTTP